MARDLMMAQPQTRTLISAYLTAREHVVDAGYGAEIDWQDSKRIGDVDESAFLREAGWVVLSTGLAESVVRIVFPRVSAAFLDWKSGDAIAGARDTCVAAGLRGFAHRGKIEAIAAIAVHVAAIGFESFHADLMARGSDLLMEFDYLGPATSRHLAKNIGLDVVKPDRHLIRAAAAAGCTSPDELCSIVSAATGDRLGTVDLVFWRYGTLVRNFHLLFCRAHLNGRRDERSDRSSRTSPRPGYVYVGA